MKPLLSSVSMVGFSLLVDQRYLKTSTRTMIYYYLDAGYWPMPFVFFKPTAIPKYVQALAKRSMSLWMPSRTQTAFFRRELRQVLFICK
ncbi:hypothetical protein DPMN_180079 [Dreissena polymorpha]|uniref:Uncharacterized protein n=1 Tax=Dreissena polymorpha TaxID=45954 RepID=A0A9D4ILC2_DREPO|nr:hypothetical protein DPMN_180079 [Dreissena polymorpha]